MEDFYSCQSHGQQALRPVASTSPSAGPIKKLNVEELNERRRLELCFHCNEQYGPGHKCKRLFSIQAVIDPEDDDVEMEIKSPLSPDLPSVLIYAISRVCDFKTMQTRGHLKNKVVMVLLRLW